MDVAKRVNIDKRIRFRVKYITTHDINEIDY